MPALRLAAGAGLLALLAAGSVGAQRPSPEVAFVRGGDLVVLSLATGAERVAARHVSGQVRLAPGGRFASAGGRIAGGPSLPAADLAWAPGGDRAAYVTRAGGVVVWSPAGSRTVVPGGWGAQGVAWGPEGALAIGRAVCRGACGLPSQTAVWTWRDGTLRRLAAAPGRGRPLPAGWRRGRVLWWNWPNSGSIAADGVALFANTRRLTDTLMYPDYVAVCGTHLAVAAGGDRYAMHGKRILLDGRDVSRDRTRSWVSPTCSADGTVVAAASENTIPQRIGREHRALWRLRPDRRQLTHPPPGWTDEYPHILGDGSIFFVRTRLTSQRSGDRWVDTLRGRLIVLSGGSERQVAELTFRTDEAQDISNYYGHYAWPSLFAVSP